ncbi:energy transducer TonB [Saccharicrinis sp. FJH54]|uniref:energy transducer TonB n=1 Tax=Saccharicrinis sp. FJH54 TaxID=3344665 RepID=UPI0035D4920E
MIKKIIAFITGFILISFHSYSINSDTLRCVPYTDSISKTEYYVFVDSMPHYPGGDGELIKFFMNNFQYPQEIDACCMIIIGFIIDAEGKMKDLKIIRSLQDDFDKEVLRVMRLMPDWKPGKCSGKPVPVKMTFPLNFKLQ